MFTYDINDLVTAFPTPTNYSHFGTGSRLGQALSLLDIKRIIKHCFCITFPYQKSFKWLVHRKLYKSHSWTKLKYLTSDDNKIMIIFTSLTCFHLVYKYCCYIVTYFLINKLRIWIDFDRFAVCWLILVSFSIYNFFNYYCSNPLAQRCINIAFCSND